MTTVDVLLATYNGAHYLPALLNSLEAQTFEDWQLIVRDDGSSDGTLDIVKDWAARIGRTVNVIEDGDAGLGPSGNFSRILAASQSPYFAFCDQDDIWLPEKIERLLKAAICTEKSVGPGVPVLVHCDLKVVKEDLSVIHNSFWDQQDFAYRNACQGPSGYHVRKSLALRNFVTGCAMLGNADLRQCMLPVPRDFSMHDWWAAHSAAQRGTITKVDDALVLYRQHASNAVGAKTRTFRTMMEKLLNEPAQALKRTRRASSMLSRQASIVLERFAHEMPSDESRFIQDFSEVGRGLSRLSGWRLLLWSIRTRQHRALTTLLVFETVSPTVSKPDRRPHGSS
ncbi:glycosyltransferase family 2 protein [Alisedimentitalea sp. MJ-SS2]|uniref:glycosyltransferase family 2 protein n=1 Tax=Aliisedimentitalea sp. MJ-SS2 TaxID=3049795 RepID=UPI002914C955|nr:glycosyltransferase family 2 protein [Alisedimentitalea sp. MJ-SS2]MDU8928291.1 glycosyltransferase family 2 protein [Alisedimentitalea sp. MJ-SS2]